MTTEKQSGERDERKPGPDSWATEPVTMALHTSHRIFERDADRQDVEAHEAGDHSNCDPEGECYPGWVAWRFSSTGANSDLGDKLPEDHSHNIHTDCPAELRCHRADMERRAFIQAELLARRPVATVRPIRDDADELQWHEGVVHGSDHPRVLELEPDDIVFMPNPVVKRTDDPLGPGLAEILGCSRVYYDTSLRGPWVFRKAGR